MIIILSKNYCKVYSSGLTKQSQTIQQHKHAIGGYTGYTQPSFTGSPVNTDEKGGHSHTTNSLKNNSGAAITSTGDMSKNSTGMCTAIPRGMDMWNDNPKWSGNMWWEDGGHGTWSKSGASQGMMVEGYLKNNVSHVHDMQHKHGTDTQGSHTHSVTADGTIENHRHSLPSNTSDTGDIETRPENLTIKIWKRTA